jgi:hypothetical protein
MKRRLRIRISEQRAELWEWPERRPEEKPEERLAKSYPISTSAFGVGSEVGSFKTPLGRFEVADKIGHEHALGAIFKARSFTGQLWSPDLKVEDDLICSRILRLRGLDTHNANTYERYIYLHGTNHEDKLGRPVSHGCIRFSNAHVCELFELLPEGSLVEIVES